jgi:hypothetical protein
MPDLQAARHALDRTLIFVDREGYSSGENVTLSATDFNAMVTCRDALDSLLSRPADYVGDLVVDLEWVPYATNGKSDIEGYTCESILGEIYVVWRAARGPWCWTSDDENAWPCDSLEHGKALCRADFLGRIAGALKSGKET